MILRTKIKRKCESNQLTLNMRLELVHNRLLLLGHGQLLRVRRRHARTQIRLLLLQPHLSLESSPITHRVARDQTRRTVFTIRFCNTLITLGCSWRTEFTQNAIRYVGRGMRKVNTVTEWLISSTSLQRISSICSDCSRSGVFARPNVAQSGSFAARICHQLSLQAAARGNTAAIW